MARLRILSWNIRTFATHPPTEGDLRRIADIIVASQAGIVCIQELQIGTGVVGTVGAPIGIASTDAVAELRVMLDEIDPGGDWWSDSSGVNSGISDHMRDAYAFIWKQTPVKSKSAHAEAPDQINDMAESVILRMMGKDTFPGRRPGMFTVNVHVGTAVVPVNIISYHAQTPVNRFSKGKGSGYGINSLALLPEIGGGMQKGTGRSWSYEDEVTPLPQIDTVVVGDFNYSMDQKWAQFTYNNLLSNYQACVSDPSKVVYTTYAPSGQQALRLVSSYDNIFVLRKHSTFTPYLAYAASGAIDFIKQESIKLGTAIGFRDFGTEAAWYVIHQDMYKKQHAVRGLSDHLPVWAEFTLGAADATARHIQPTSGANFNCLLHAVFGAPVNGMYVDAAAATHRTNMVTLLTGYRTGRAIPSAGRLAPLRAAILSAMINDFDDRPVTVGQLRLLLQNTTNPFDVEGFDEAFGEYIGNINDGRMLYVHEAEVLACQQDIPLTLHYMDRGQYRTTTFCAGGQQPAVHIYHQALHFFRWTP
jgi:endonuclease/exonuclease/phosphatase family metal-dependent hydrolase